MEISEARVGELFIASSKDLVVLRSFSILDTKFETIQTKS